MFAERLCRCFRGFKKKAARKKAKLKRKKGDVFNTRGVAK
jgi:hypothetical protein